MKKKRLILTVLVVIVCPILLVGVMIYMHEVNSSKFRYQSEIDCFAGAAIKCGSVDNTKEEIIKEIDYLNLSLGEAREIILKSQNEGEIYYTKLESKKVLDENEKYVLDNKWKQEKYFERVLEVIEERAER